MNKAFILWSDSLDALTKQILGLSQDPVGFSIYALKGRDRALQGAQLSTAIGSAQPNLVKNTYQDISILQWGATP